MSVHGRYTCFDHSPTNAAINGVAKMIDQSMSQLASLKLPYGETFANNLWS